MSFTLISKTRDERKEGGKDRWKKSHIEVAAPPKNQCPLFKIFMVLANFTQGGNNMVPVTT